MTKPYDIQRMERIMNKVLGIWIFFATMPLLAQERSEDSYRIVGEDFQSQHVLSGMEIEEQYLRLHSGDSLTANVKGVVSSVCQQKGCWMTLELQEGQEVMVRFKDYAFFVPKNITGQTVILKGKAFVSEMSVEEQRHYAEDEGLSRESIERINSPKKTFSFVATGVKIKEQP